MSEKCVCGYINIDDEILPVWCDPVSGDCYYVDNVGSACMIDGISINNPKTVENIQQLATAGYMGVLNAVTGEYHILNEDRAEYVDDDGNICSVTIDIYADCDMELDEGDYD